MQASFRWSIAAGIAVLAGLAFVLVPTRVETPPASAGTVLITGANRGIGLALTREYATRGWQVIATARRPDAAADLNALAAANGKVRVERLDVTSDADIAALAAGLKGVPIDVLLNNAGSNAGGRGQKPGSFDYAVLHELMDINVAGPLKVTEALLPNVLASAQKKVIVISSTQASIAGTFGGSYFYRASKAALNMVMRTLSRDLKDEGVVIGILSPGVVETDMTRGVDYPMITPEEAARALATQIGELTPARSGDFIEHDGSTVPW